ncbi:hypothetical protein EJ110_NYTH11631 [Nymphaea thermarum]|nr:hypothetical protein EJ110_NYTH11631 [Nymphaea thermarum]
MRSLIQAKLKEEEQEEEEETYGPREIDNILRGGIQMGVITEIYGESNSGKTQLCYTLCVTFLLPSDQEDGARKVLYIDSRIAFHTERLQEIAARLRDSVVHPRE